MMEYVPECGDVGFVGYEDGDGFLSDGIIEMTTGKDEARTVAVHQFQVIAGGDIVEADAVKFGRVIVRSWAERKADVEANKKAHFIIFRPNLNTYQKAAIEFYGRRMAGRLYGYAEGLLQAADGLLRKIGLLKERQPFFTFMGGIIPGTVICSGVGNELLARVKVLPWKSRFWAPDDTFDVAVEEEWPVVGMDQGSDAFVYWGRAF